MAKKLLASVYHPYDASYSRFITALDTILSRASNDWDIIMGDNVNAQVGRQDCEKLEDILGPFGLDKRDEKAKISSRSTKTTTFI